MSDQAAPPPDGAPDDAFDRILAGDEDRELLALYSRKDAAAVLERRRLFRMLRAINWLVLSVALLSGLILARASFDTAATWLGVSKDVLERVVYWMTIAVAVTTIAVTAIGRLAREGDRLGRFQRLRADAEMARSDRFKALARAAAASGPGSAATALELVTRDLLKEQRDWYLRRAEQHDDSARITGVFSTVAIVLSALTSAFAISLSINPGSGWLLIFGVFAAALAAFAVDREHLERDRSNAELYRNAADRLSQLATRLQQVKADVAQGNAQAVVAFTDTVAEELVAEHRQWVNGLTVTAELLARLEERLQQARTPSAGTANGASPAAPPDSTADAARSGVQDLVTTVIAGGGGDAIVDAAVRGAAKVAGAAAAEAGLGGAIADATQLAQQLERWKPLLGAAAEALPPPHGDQARALLAEAGTATGLLANAGAAGGDPATQVATALLDRLRSGNPVGDWFDATAPKLAGIVGTVLPPLGLALAAAGIGAQLGMQAYRRWVTRVLAAPFAPHQLELGEMGPNELLAALAVAPGFGAALAPERDRGDMAFLTGLLPDVLGEGDALWPRLQDRFGGDRARFDAALRELHAALLGQASDPGVTTVAERAGTTPQALLAGLGQLRSEPAGNEALNVAVQLADSLRLAGVDDPAAVLTAATGGKDP